MLDVETFGPPGGLYVPDTEALGPPGGPAMADAGAVRTDVRADHATLRGRPSIQPRIEDAAERRVCRTRPSARA